MFDRSSAPMLRRELDPRCLDVIAAPGRGIVSIGQLHDAGMTRAQVRSLVDRGVLIRIHRGVYRTAGTAMSTRRRLVAACLAIDGLSAASHRAALWLWGLSDRQPPIELSVTAARHPDLVGCLVHQSRDLAPDDVTVRRGVAVTKPARTLVDVGCVVPAWEFSESLERAVHRRLVTVAALRAIVERVGGRGRNGVGILRTTLDERALGATRPESVLEPLLARLCARNNIEGVVYQAELVLDGRTIRPDFLIPDAMLVIEVDGLAVHGTREALDSDLERQNLLIAHGYLVLRYTVTHLRDPDRVAAQILRTARRRRHELASSL